MFQQDAGLISTMVTSARTSDVPPDPLQVLEVLVGLENRFRHVAKRVLSDAEFLAKYDFSLKEAFDGALFYLSTSQPTPMRYVIEAFPVVHDQPTGGGAKRIEELTYHWVFEDVIERYTKSRKKPNNVLMETRATDFCYLLTIKIESVPADLARRPMSFALLREFQILQHLWESYRAEVIANKCNTDQLIGFPMPFEFRSIESTDFDMDDKLSYDYYSPSGRLEPLLRVTLPSFSPVAETHSIRSTLSYMSMEKVGPNLGYLMALMMSQGKCFSVSSALKVYDQMISRLTILHKYSVVHSDVNPTTFSFGTGEAVNVLYVSSFEPALVLPTTSAPLPFFHDRFVAHTRMKDKSAHFVHDLEAAFYVFVYLIFGRLPWDSRLVAKDNESSVGSGSATLDISLRNYITEKSRTVEDKEKFWQSSNQFQWMVKSIEMEINDRSYQNFTSDIVESIYARVKETIATCHVIGQSQFAKDVLLQGSAPYNAYFGVRKIIASYFRFETRSKALNDPVWSAKTENLLKYSDIDRRMAWDMSFWCWNYLDTSTAASPAASSGLKSAIAGR